MYVILSTNCERRQQPAFVCSVEDLIARWLIQIKKLPCVVWLITVYPAYNRNDALISS
jgi:hypothetical protein